MRLGVLAALDQRIGVRYAMAPMTPERNRRLPAASHPARRPRRHPFQRRRRRLIHHAARGFPRAVNNIATQALVAACAARKNIVDEQSARAAVNEITSD